MERAEIGIDGNCGFALLGEDLQVGEAEFVEIKLPAEASKDPNRYHKSEWRGLRRPPRPPLTGRSKRDCRREFSMTSFSHPDHC